MERAKVISILLVIGLVVGITAGAAYSGDNFRPVVSALEKADAVVGITNIVSDYCRGYDKKDIDLLMSVWADDAHVVWTDAKWDLKGKAAIKDAYMKSMAAWSNSRHNVYNWNIKVKANTATSTHYWAWHADDSKGTKWAGEGSYEREFVKDNGTWKIKYQKIIMDWFKPQDPQAIQEIKNTVADYCRGYDKKDIDLLMSVWADDAHVVWTDAKWDLKGKAAIKDAYMKSMAAWSNSRHNVYNWYIKVKANTATSTQYWSWHADNSKGNTWAGEGGYEREFVKENGAWKIKYQKITQDWFKQVTGGS
ncbi:MAG: nuclear transport factor 2 family protein [Deltaproteobacteria bacterium]|nr:nuclear transport factor 2 family protein [Deltaproteobacteria bacterium]